MRKVLDNIQIVVNGCKDMQDKEIRAYINKVRPEKGVVLKKLIITIMPGDPDNVVLDWETDKEHFERIRRITGYLVGTLDRFNNGKRAEERDRVKHGVSA